MSYYRLNKEKLKFFQKEYRFSKKLECFNVMGLKCVVCGFSDIRALQVDHINGDGYLEARRDRNGYRRGSLRNGPDYTKVMESYLRKEGKFQLLCANCNQIKKIENHEHGGKKDIKYATRFIQGKLL